MSESESSNTGFAAALELWQENQLRILVLISLATQCFLFVFAPLRQHRIPGPLRLSIWLAYLGSDAVAIYALATLFNSHRCDTGTGTGTARAGVELLWAPIMLVHLGGQDSIPAYNIEDNELWRRHVVTAVSQVILVNLSSTALTSSNAHLISNNGAWSDTDDRSPLLSMCSSSRGQNPWRRLLPI
jgi:hypothetical protein